MDSDNDKILWSRNSSYKFMDNFVGLWDSKKRLKKLGLRTLKEIRGSKKDCQLTSTHFTYEYQTFPLTDIVDFGLNSNRLSIAEKFIEIQLNSNYERPYIYFSSLNSSNPEAYDELMHLFRLLCKLLNSRKKLDHFNHAINFEEFNYKEFIPVVDVQFNKDKYLAGDKVDVQLEFHGPYPKKMKEISIQISSGEWCRIIDTQFNEYVIIDDAYSVDTYFDRWFGENRLRIKGEPEQKRYTLKYQLPQKSYEPTIPIGNMQVSHKVRIWLVGKKRKILHFIVFSIPYQHHTSVVPAKSVTMTDKNVSITIDKDVVFPHDEIEIQGSISSEVTQNTHLELEWIKLKIEQRVTVSFPIRKKKKNETKLIKRSRKLDRSGKIRNVTLPIKREIPYFDSSTYTGIKGTMQYYLMCKGKVSGGKKFKVEILLTYYREHYTDVPHSKS